MTVPAEARMDWLDKLVRIPSHKGREGARREAALLCADMLEETGFETALAGPTDAPAVIAWLGEGMERRLLFYSHYDVVPPGDPDQWQTDPFTPTIVGDRLVARGVSDHKASFVARLAAVARLKSEGRLQAGITFLVEGEEEVGSPSLEGVLKTFAGRLRADGGLYSGGARDEDGRMVIRAGCKGRCGIRLSVTAADRDNHSKWAAILPSAGWRLVAALSSLRDERTGRVLVDGFYDGVAGPDRRDEAALAKLRFDTDALLGAVGHKALAEGARRDPLRALMFEPTFNLAWIDSGNGGGTVLPGSASAMLDIRLVPGQSSQRVAALVAAQLEANGYGDVELVLEGGSEPDKCDLSDPVVVALEQACAGSGTDYCIHPMGAGSGPRHLFRRHLGYSLVQDPGCSWSGSNDHAANENIILDHFDENRRLIEQFLIAYGQSREQPTS